VRAHIGFEQGNVLRLKGTRQPTELAEVLCIDADDGFLVEGLQRELTHLHARHGREVRFDLCPVPGRDECDGGLGGQEHFDRPCIGCEPVLDLRACRRIPPVASEDEAVEVGGCHERFENRGRRESA